MEKINLASSLATKRLAKRLQKYTRGSSSRTIPQVNGQEAHRCIALVLGYDGILDLNNSFKNRNRAISTDDWDVSINERRGRRRAQADALAKRLECSSAPGYALISLVLPTTSLSRERSEIGKRTADIGVPEEIITRWHTQGLRQPREFWLDVTDTCYQFGFDPLSHEDIDLAVGIVMERMGLGAGIGHFRLGAGAPEAHKALTEDKRGYVAIVMPGLNFWQGFFVPELDPAHVDAEIDLLVGLLDAGSINEQSEREKIANSCGAAICAMALDPDMTEESQGKIAILVAAMVRLIGHEYLLIHGVDDSDPENGGISTSIEKVEAASIDEAKVQIDKHPVIVDCKKRLMAGQKRSMDRN